MNPEIYDVKEIVLTRSLLKRFKAVITDNEELYGFSLGEFNEVEESFPNVDLYDEAPHDNDASWIVLNNMFAFLMDDNPCVILNKEEYSLVKELWGKLKNV